MVSARRLLRSDARHGTRYGGGRDTDEAARASDTDRPSRERGSDCMTPAGDQSQSVLVCETAPDGARTRHRAAADK